MKFMFLLPLFFGLSVSVAINLDAILADPLGFSSVMHSLEPNEVQKTVDELQALIDIGEEFREKAQSDRDHYLQLRDDATLVRDNAHASLTETLGNLKRSEEEVDRLQGEKSTATSLVNDRVNEKDVADQLVLDETAELENENIRVDSERATLEKVLGILNGLLPQEESFIESSSNRKLLSRTTTLLSDPSFLAALEKADPVAVGQVIGLVEKLIQDGEDARNLAIKEHQDAVDAASLAAQNLVDAQDDLNRISGELVNEEDNVLDLKSEKENKTNFLQDKQSLLDLAQIDYDTYQKILDDETERINGEKSTLDEAVEKLTVMVEVIQTLA